MRALRLEPAPPMRAAGLATAIVVVGPAAGFAAAGHALAGFLGAVVGLLLSLLDVGGSLARRGSAIALFTGSLLAGSALGLAVRERPWAFWPSLLGAAFVAGAVQGGARPAPAVCRAFAFGLVVVAVTPLVGRDATVAVVATSLLVLAVEAVRAARAGPTVALADETTIARAMRDALVRRPAGPRFALVYAVASAGALLFGRAIGAARPFWIAVTTMAVLQPDLSATHRRIVERALGTAMGVGLVAALVRVAPPGWYLVPIAAAVAYLVPRGVAQGYWLFSLLVAVLVLVLLDFASLGHGLPRGLMVERFLDALAGCGIAFVATWIAYPPSR